MDRVYFSKNLDPTSWEGEDYGCLSFLLIPSKWWSIKEWQFAWSLRRTMLERLMRAHSMFKSEEV